MSARRQSDGRGGGRPDSKASRVTVTVDFDQESNPELWAAVTAVSPGKQRAQRVRSLMLKGCMVELMQGLPAKTVAPRVASAASESGADDVFGAPVDG